MIQKLISFARLTRPLFLLGGILLYFLGVLLAISDGYTLNVKNILLGQALVTTIQLMTHYLNEYFDFESDALNASRTWFSGGSGVLTSGQLPPQVAWYTAMLLAVVALVLLVLIGLQTPSIIAVGAAGLFLAWFYSAPPLRMCARGTGEISASVVVALLVPTVGFGLQANGAISPGLLVLCLPLFLLHAAMLIAFSIPDYEADMAAGKKTLAVQLGLPRAVKVHNGLLALAYAAITLLAAGGWPGAALFYLPLPLAIWQAISINQAARAQAIHFLGLTMRAIALFAATAGIFVLSTYLVMQWR